MTDDDLDTLLHALPSDDLDGARRESLRDAARHELAASAVTVFISTDRFRPVPAPYAESSTYSAAYPTDVNRELIAQLDPVKFEKFSFRGANGDQVWGFKLKPAGAATAASAAKLPIATTFVQRMVGA